MCWTARAAYVTSPNDGHTAQQRLVVPEPSTITRCDSRRGFGALAQLRSRPVQAGSACLTDFGLIAAASQSVGLADAVVWGWSSACVSAKMCPRREQGRRRRSNDAETSRRINGLRGPRYSCYLDADAEDTSRPSAPCACRSQPACHAPVRLPKSQVSKRLQENSRKFGSTKNLLRENGC